MGLSPVSEGSARDCALPLYQEMYLDVKGSFLPPELTDDTLAGILSEYGDLKTAERHTSARIFLDTFDGRLFKQGSVLEALEGDDGTELEWRSTDGRRIGSGTGCAPAGGFAWDLHPAEFRSALEPVLGARVLLPLVGEPFDKVTEFLSRKRSPFMA
ncbi:MAG: RNA-binding protein, partial [Thermoleophilia bacterium]